MRLALVHVHLLSCLPPYSTGNATTECREFTGVLVDSASGGGTFGPPHSAQKPNAPNVYGALREGTFYDGKTEKVPP